MAQDITLRHALEFDIVDYCRAQYNLSLNGELEKVPGCRDGLVYTILDKKFYPEPVGALVRHVPFEMQSSIDRIVWKLADLTPSANFWMLAYFLQEDDLERLSDRQPVLTENTGRFLTKYQKGDSIGLPTDIGCGNMDGFHLFAVPIGGETDRMFRSIMENRINTDVIRKMSWDTEFTLRDSFFEMRPFGDEDREHIEIICSSDITTDTTRRILRDVYQMDYSVVTLTAAEFDRWEDTGALPDSHMRFLD